MSFIESCGLSKSNLEVLGSIKSVSRMIRYPSGSGRISIRDGFEMVSSHKIKFGFDLEQTAFSPSMYRLTQVVQVQERRMEVLVDLKKGTAQGTDYCWMENPAKNIRSGETLKIPEFYLAGETKKATLPHSPGDPVIGTLGAMLGRLIVPVKEYGEKEFELEANVRPLSIWAKDVESVLKIDPLYEEGVAPQAVYRTMVAMQKMFKALSD